MERSPAPHSQTESVRAEPVLAALARATGPSAPQTLALELDIEGQGELAEILARTKRRLAEIEAAARKRLQDPCRQENPVSVGVVMLRRAKG
jgi:hypothetical protein